MPRLIKCITHADYKFLKEKFLIPPRDEETELLKYDIASPHYVNVWPKSKLSLISRKRKEVMMRL